MSYLRKRAGIIALAASLLGGALAPLAATPAAAASDPLAGSAGPSPLYPSMATDTWQPIVPPGVDVDTFERHPVLSWQPITDLPVAHYHVELSPNGDWTDNVVTLPDGGITTATQYELPTTLPHASYFWRVRAEDANGGHTNWAGAADDTSKWQFTRTWTDRPAVLGSNLADGSIDLRWSALPDASSYEVQISNDWLFPDPQPDGIVVFTCFVNHPRWSLARGTNDGPTAGDCGDHKKLMKAIFGGGGPFYWRVRGVDGTTAPAVTTETAVTCFQSGADCSGWSAVTTLSIPDTSGTVSGATGNLSVNCPASVSGGDGEPLCYDTPTMSWDAVPNADAYLVEVSVDPMFSTDYRQYAVWLGHTLTPRDSYLDNQSGRSYFWRVMPCDYDALLDAFMCEGASSSAQFHKASHPLPLAPASTSASTPGHDGLYTTVGNAETFADRTTQVRTDQVTFHWDDYLTAMQQAGYASVQEAKRYLVEYADNAYFDGATTVSVDATKWTPPSTLPDGTYYWRVQPVDGSNNHLTWSPARAFVKGTVPPIAQITSSGYLNPFQKVEVDFSSPVSGVDSSTLGLLDAVTGSHIAGTVDFPNPGTAFVKPSSPLVPGQLLKVWVSGIHDLAGNTAKAGTNIAQVDPVVDNSSSLVKEAWDEDNDSHAYGGTFAQSSSKGDRIMFSFWGTSMRLYGTRTPSGGYADVYIDGSRKGAASFYAASTRWRQQVFSASLNSGHHWMSVIVRGGHPTGSTGNDVYVDAVSTPYGMLAEHGGRTVQTWSRHRATDASAGSYDAVAGYQSYHDTGSHPQLLTKVSGRTISVYGCRSPESGYVGVWVDGTYVGSADLYQSYSSCNALVFHTTVANGTHRVLLMPGGRHRSAAKGTTVSIDRIVVS